MSPDSPEPETEYQLTPRTEAKYSKIDEEFQMMLQRNQLNGQRVCNYYRERNLSENVFRIVQSLIINVCLPDRS